MEINKQTNGYFGENPFISVKAMSNVNISRYYEVAHVCLKNKHKDCYASACMFDACYLQKLTCINALARMFTFDMVLKHSITIFIFQSIMSAIKHKYFFFPDDVSLRESWLHVKLKRTYICHFFIYKIKMTLILTYIQRDLYFWKWCPMENWKQRLAVCPNSF